MESVLSRFLRYVQIDTRSDPASKIWPSTPGQLDLAKLLYAEMEKMGLEDIHLDENGYLMATLPANSDEDLPVLGLISHLDTSPDVSGYQVKPRIVQGYDGGDILLDQEKKIILSADEFPELLAYQGQDIVVSNGGTLLGADDKAGVAEIMSTLDYFVHNPEQKHPLIRVAFTPDEELGISADKFDVERFAADFAYTVDGGELGELEYENFNAAAARILIHGRNVHPGSAKDKMLNALLIGMEFNSLLPVEQRPEFTQGWEGFYHLFAFRANVEECRMEYILRDHDWQLFEKKKELIQQAARWINEKYGPGTLELAIRDQYYNMKEKIEPVYPIIELACQAMQSAGVKPKIQPIRGGTDGARLSFMGLPCPNLFTGGHNFHSRYEFIPVQSMEKAVQTLVNLCSEEGILALKIKNVLELQK